jgi:hypothetical protein
MANTLSNSAVLVGFSCTSYTARAADVDMRNELAASRKINSKALNVTKDLFPQKPAALRRINSHIEAIRADHLRMTLPWADTGLRILPMTQYQAYTDKMNQNLELLDRYIDAWINVMPDEQVEAESILGTSYDSSQYLDSAEMKARYKVTRITQAIADNPTDIRLNNTTAVDEQKIRDEMMKDIGLNMKAAIGDLYTRLADAAYDLSRKLVNENSGTRQKSIAGLLATVDQAERLNFTNDAGLTQLANGIRHVLKGVDAKSLKKDGGLKDALAHELEEYAEVAKEGAA